MSENKTVNVANTIQKKIGNTTYIVTSRFNGEKKHDMASILIRLIEREIANVAPPKIGA